VQKRKNLGEREKKGEGRGSERGEGAGASGRTMDEEEVNKEQSPQDRRLVIMTWPPGERTMSKEVYSDLDNGGEGAPMG